MPVQLNFFSSWVPVNLNIICKKYIYNVLYHSKGFQNNAVRLISRRKTGFAKSKTTSLAAEARIFEMPAMFMNVSMDSLPLIPRNSLKHTNQVKFQDDPVATFYLPIDLRQNLNNMIFFLSFIPLNLE